MIVLNEGNTGDNILVERMKATRISQAAVSIESWKGGTFGNVTFRDISISYEGNKNPEQTPVSYPVGAGMRVMCKIWFLRM